MKASETRQALAELLRGPGFLQCTPNDPAVQKAMEFADTYAQDEKREGQLEVLEEMLRIDAENEGWPGIDKLRKRIEGGE